MLFHIMRNNLLKEIGRRIHNGEFTERSLARFLGVSQPHIHNVLAGVRTLSVDLADLIIWKLKIPPARLAEGTALSPANYSQSAAAHPSSGATS